MKKASYNLSYVMSLPTIGEVFEQIRMCFSSYEKKLNDWQEGIRQTEQYLILKINFWLYLSWDNHIATFTQRASKYVTFLRKIRSLYSFKSLKRKHNCIIYSKLINGNSIKHHIRKLIWNHWFYCITRSCVPWRECTLLIQHISRTSSFWSWILNKITFTCKKCFLKNVISMMNSFPGFLDLFN